MGELPRWSRVPVKEPPGAVHGAWQEACGEAMRKGGQIANIAERFTFLSMLGGAVRWRCTGQRLRLQSTRVQLFHFLEKLSLLLELSPFVRCRYLSTLQ